MEGIVKNYKGLPKQVWLFFVMVLINRLGAMVVPFLSKYLYEDLKFDYLDIGTIMVFYGIGSFLGTFLGGELTKYFSNFRLMIFSMFFNGVIIFCMQYVKSFFGLCGMALLLNMVSDIFRPTMTASLKDYVSKADRLRTFALIRTASNFGFLISPVLAGILVIAFGYKFLFIVDGLSSIIAVIVFVIFVQEKRLLYKLKLKKLNEEKFVFFKDKIMLLHCLIIIFKGIVFFQIFTVLPLFYDVVLHLPDAYHSVYLCFYGAILFLCEVSVVSLIKKYNLRPLNSILYGLLLMGLGYCLLAIFPSQYTVYFSLFFIAFGVMFSFPFASDFVLERSYKNQEGKFLSYFQMSYAIAHILSAKIGMFIVNYYGYTLNFGINFVITLLGAFLSYNLIYMVIRERKAKKDVIVKSFFN